MFNVSHPKGGKAAKPVVTVEYSDSGRQITEQAGAHHAA